MPLMPVNPKANQSLKRSYKAHSLTERILVKQDFKVSKKMMSNVITLTLFKVHVNPFTGPMELRGGIKEKSKQ